MPAGTIRTALLLCTIALALPAGAEDNQWTDASNIGFNGPVHEVRTIIRRPFPDPRKDSNIPVDHFCARCTFDRQGHFIERTSEDQSGFQNTTRYTRDEQGRVLETQDIRDGQVVSHTTSVNGPNGPLEVQEWVGDQPTGWMVYRYPEAGTIRTSHLAADGTLNSETTEKTDSSGNLLEAYHRWPGGGTRMTYSYDVSGSLAQMQEFDSDGKLLMRATFADDKIQSWWKQAGTGSGVGWIDHQGSLFYSYSSQTDGTLEMTVYDSQGRPDAHSFSEARHYDASGHLTEKVTCDYDFDAQGNWIRRTVWVWDLNKGGAVVVEEGQRTIRYY